MASKSETRTLVVRIRSRLGTWRVDGLSRTSTIRVVNQRVLKEHNLKAGSVTWTLDQGGKSPASESATLGALGIKHGDILFAQISKDAAVGTGPVKIVKGRVVNQSYDERSRTEGFRPGLMALRSMKMHWTLHDFNQLESRYTYTMKGDQVAFCKGVSLHTAACNVYQQYAKSLAFSPRAAYLYGKRVEGNKLQAEVFYEPPQHVDATGGTALDEDDPKGKQVERLALWLGLEKVGFVFCHPQRNEKELGYRFTSYELLEAAEQHLQAIGDPMSETGFAVIAVTANREGKAEFDAFQVTQQCLQMLDTGVLLEHEEEPGLLKVHDTYTVMVENRPTDKVSTYRCLKAVPIAQHRGNKCDPQLNCTFPVCNRGRSVPTGHAALRAHLVNTAQQPHVQRIADFQVLLCLTGIMGEEAVKDLCMSVRNPDKVPIKEGYKLIIDSLLQ